MRHAVCLIARWMSGGAPGKWAKPGEEAKRDKRGKPLQSRSFFKNTHIFEKEGGKGIRRAELWNCALFKTQREKEIGESGKTKMG